MTLIQDMRCEGKIVGVIAFQLWKELPAKNSFINKYIRENPTTQARF
jgi:hypothetical protein